MTIVYGQLISGGNIIYGQLDQSLITAYNHAGQDVIALSANGTHSLDIVYEHGLGAEVDVYSVDGHEFVATPTAPSYAHTGVNEMQLFDAGTHEHIPFLAVYVHTDPIEFDLSDNGVHLFTPGSATDYLHSGTDSFTLSSSGTHSYSAAFDASTAVYDIVIEPWLDSTASDNVIDFTGLATISSVRFSINSSDVDWVSGIGPSGGALAAAFEIVTANNEVIPISSVNSQYPLAVLFSGGFDRFDDVSAALLSGPVTVRVGGYEGFQTYSIPNRINGLSTVTVQALA